VNTAFLLIEQIPPISNHAAVPLKDFPSMERIMFSLKWDLGIAAES
jgi:hypothetical protein